MKIVFTPDWFLGQDFLIEIFSFMILFLFFFFSIKSYKLSKNKKVLYLGIGFLLIAIGELSTILTKLVLYYDTTITQNIGQIVITYAVVKSVDIFYHLGFFLHKFFTLFGLYIIYRPPLKRISGDFVLTTYFIIISALLSQSFYYVYHITALIFLFLIINNYCKIYKKSKLANTKILLIALSLLAISQIIFILSKLSQLYVIAQNIQLISYITLLVLIMRISKNGKKKEQNRDNI